MLLNSLERWQKLITKIRANLVFQARVSFFEVFQEKDLKEMLAIPILLYRHVSRFLGVPDKSGALLLLPSSHKRAANNLGEISPKMGAPNPLF